MDDSHPLDSVLGQPFPVALRTLSAIWCKKSLCSRITTKSTALAEFCDEGYLYLFSLSIVTCMRSSPMQVAVFYNLENIHLFIYLIPATSPDAVLN